MAVHRVKLSRTVPQPTTTPTCVYNNNEISKTIRDEINPKNYKQKYKKYYYNDLLNIV